MSEMTDKDYDALADRLSAPDHTLARPQAAAAGDDAATAGRDFLLREYGSMDAVTDVLRGRPRVGQTRRGASPTVRGRVTVTDYEALKKLETSTGRTQSELVREAVHRLLESHKLVS